MRARGLRRILAVCAVVAVGSAVITAQAQAQVGESTSPVVPRVTEALDKQVRHGTPAQAARAYLDDHRDTYRVSVADLMTERTRADGGQSSVRFQQRHHGVTVFGAQYAVQTEAADGGHRVTSAIGTLYPHLTVSTTPAVSEPAASQRMFLLDSHLAGLGQTRTDSGGLVVLPNSRGGRLAWHFTVTGEKEDGSPVRQEVFVDAHIGGVALSYDSLHAADAAPAWGTGVKMDGSQEPIAVNRESDGSYTLADSSRAMFGSTGGQIRTYDARRMNYLQVAGGPVPDGTGLAASATDRFDGAATTSGAVDAHVNTGKVYEYYRTVIGRDGIDGQGGTIYSVVNVASGGKDYANAFWDGSKMVYGHLKGVPLSVGLDVVGKLR